MWMNFSGLHRVLNSLEHLWDDLEQRQDVSFKLTNVLLEECEIQYPLNILLNLLNSLLRRDETVLAAKDERCQIKRFKNGM